MPYSLCGERRALIGQQADLSEARFLMVYSISSGIIDYGTGFKYKTCSTSGSVSLNTTRLELTVSAEDTTSLGQAR